jgi:hypothetical protein
LILQQYYGLQAFKPGDLPGYKRTEVDLVPNDVDRYPDTYFSQLSGLYSANPCVEHTLLDSNIGAEIMYSFSQINHWQMIDKAVRRLVASFLIKPRQD